MQIPAQVQDMIAAGALVVCNHSGGKDSQAMYLQLRQIVPAAQLVVVHAHLPGVEWDGILEHIEATTDHPVHVVQAGKTFFEMVERRGMFPSPSNRQCTSDLKRDPIAKWIRRHLKANPQFQGRVVNCLGLRAEESTSRAAKPTLKLDKRLSKAGRQVLEWLPVHDLLEGQVFGQIAAAGQRAHWAYAAGMSRLSCVFCIMSSLADIHTAARLNPAAARRFAALERRVDHTMTMPQGGRRRFLDEILELQPDHGATAVQAFLEGVEGLLDQLSPNPAAIAA